MASCWMQMLRRRLSEPHAPQSSPRSSRSSRLSAPSARVRQFQRSLGRTSLGVRRSCRQRPGAAASGDTRQPIYQYMHVQGFVHRLSKQQHACHGQKWHLNRELKQANVHMLTL